MLQSRGSQRVRDDWVTELIDQSIYYTLGNIILIFENLENKVCCCTVFCIIFVSLITCWPLDFCELQVYTICLFFLPLSYFPLVYYFQELFAKYVLVPYSFVSLHTERHYFWHAFTFPSNLTTSCVFLKLNVILVPDDNYLYIKLLST